MNPGAELLANAFYFDAPGQAPRIVLFGPWVYVHAPGASIPTDFEQLPEAV